MDGNGRWAVSRGLTRGEGHAKGSENVHRIIRQAVARGVKNITLYAFSTENWRRPKDELDIYFQIFEKKITEVSDEFKKQKGRIIFVGALDEMRPSLKTLMAEAEKKTEQGSAFTVYVAMNYGGKDEIVEACKKWRDSSDAELTTETLQQYMYVPDMPPLDLIIRTSGEQRLSNFMMWHSAYAELYFIDKFWPDFAPEDLDKALDDFADRQRRFGAAS